MSLMLAELSLARHFSRESESAFVYFKAAIAGAGFFGGG
jgi:hypothetical protein